MQLAKKQEQIQTDRTGTGVFDVAVSTLMKEVLKGIDYENRLNK